VREESLIKGDFVLISTPFWTEYFYFFQNAVSDRANKQIECTKVERVLPKSVNDFKVFKK
jgi:hypothetical protein